MTVNAAMLLLLQPVHLSYSSLPWPVGVCREADCWPVPVSLLLSVVALRFSGHILRCGVMNPWSMTPPEGAAAVMPGSSPSYPRRFGWHDDPLSERAHLLPY